MKKIGIIANTTKDGGLRNTHRIVRILAGRAELYTDTQDECLGSEIKCLEYSRLIEEIQYMIVVGGDGTMLRIAPDCAERGIPVLGINMGKVGFLTETETENMTAALERLLSDDFEIENRMLIHFKKICADGNETEASALNDVVIAKGVGVKLVSIELYTDGELVNRYSADGLIIATPTGSTGYSVSAGGPLVYPSMSLYVATPICPHMLSARSAVLCAESEITVRLGALYPESCAVVTADGDFKGGFNIGDELKITRSRHEFKMIKMGSYSFYDTVLKKLS